MSRTLCRHSGILSRNVRNIDVILNRKSFNARQTQEHTRTDSSEHKNIRTMKIKMEDYIEKEFKNTKTFEQLGTMVATKAIHRNDSALFFSSANTNDVISPNNSLTTIKAKLLRNYSNMNISEDKKLPTQIHISRIIKCKIFPKSSTSLKFKKSI